MKYILLVVGLIAVSLISLAQITTNDTVLIRKANPNGKYTLEKAALTDLPYEPTATTFGRSLLQSTNAAMAQGILGTPVTITADTTNVVVDFKAGSWQLLTATTNLHVTVSNVIAGVSVLLDITAGNTNRYVTFDLGTNWMSAKPTVIPSNHVMWVSIPASGTTTNSLRPSAVQTFP